LAENPGAVQLRNVRRTFPGTGLVVEALDLKIRQGEFVSLLGPSGCGKSTILRLIAGLDAPDGGSVEVASTTGQGQIRGFVFQEANLLPWRSVLENVVLPLELMRTPRAKAVAAARLALEQVGLGDALEKLPAQLSGGMKMRTSLARALVTEPDLLLLDEPFAALDENTRHQLQEDLRALWERRKMTVVFVTHSVSEAAFLSTRSIVFSKRPARILVDRTVELPPERSARLRTDGSLLKEIELIGAAFRSHDRELRP
jgi:NitT/TauT family transport system ATP-binding protein